MPQRYDCDLPEFDGAFVEFTDVWTRGDALSFPDLEGDEYAAFVASKITALHLPLVGGDAIDDPADYTLERLKAIDLRLWHWVATLPSLEYSRLGNLGEATRRRLYESFVKITTTKATTTAA